jgi:hypothetical protein
MIAGMVRFTLEELPMPAAAKRPVSTEEYLRIDREARERCDYYRRNNINRKAKRSQDRCDDQFKQQFDHDRPSSSLAAKRAF